MERTKCSHHSLSPQTQFAKHRVWNDQIFSQLEDEKTLPALFLWVLCIYENAFVVDMDNLQSLMSADLSSPCWAPQWCRACWGEPGCHRLQEGNGSATVGKNWTWDPHTSHVSSMYHNTQISYTLVAEEVLRFVLLNSQQDKLQCAAQKLGLHLGRSQNHVGLHTGCDSVKALTLCVAAPAPVKVPLSLIYLRGISTPIH